jgi:hypothetical protein
MVKRTRFTRPLTLSVSYIYSSHVIVEQSVVSFARSRGLASLKTSATSNCGGGDELFLVSSLTYNEL